MYSTYSNRGIPHSHLTILLVLSFSWITEKRRIYLKPTVCNYFILYVMCPLKHFDIKAAWYQNFVFKKCNHCTKIIGCLTVTCTFFLWNRIHFDHIFSPDTNDVKHIVILYEAIKVQERLKFMRMRFASTFHFPTSLSTVNNAMDFEWII